MSKAPQQALLTDLYELTMAQSYFQHGMYSPAASLADIRQTFTEEFSRLPREYKALRNPSAFPVEMSRELQGLYHQMEERRSIKKVPATAKGRQSNKG